VDYSKVLANKIGNIFDGGDNRLKYKEGMSPGESGLRNSPVHEGATRTQQKEGNVE
jgi:hypothetical protein